MPQIEGSIDEESSVQQQLQDVNEASEIDKIQEQLHSFGQQLQNFQTFNNQQKPLNQTCANLSSIISAPAKSAIHNMLDR